MEMPLSAVYFAPSAAFLDIHIHFLNFIFPMDVLLGLWNTMKRGSIQPTPKVTAVSGSGQRALSLQYIHDIFFLMTHLL